jgi:glucose/arabinose dehydrogenase
VRPAEGSDKSLALGLAALALVAAGCGRSAPARLVPIGAGLEGPAGLKATVWATGVVHASAFAFDGRGRLWVTASGANTHAGDGVFVVPAAGGRAVRVVAGPRGPLGLLWHGSELIVSSLGEVSVFSGLHGDRFAHRTTILRGPPGGGENNNVVLGPDGRLYLGVSASCDHCTPPTRWSGSIVTFRLDGGGLRLFAGGIRAPYGLAFRPGTDDLFASMNQRDDLGARTPGDWLAVVSQGEHWGFPDCYGQPGAACAGVPKPVDVLDPHAAAGGVAFQGDTALVAEWQLGKVMRVALRKDGPGYTGTVSTYLTGIEHPLPVATTAGGAVLVGDWGSGLIYRIAPA